MIMIINARYFFLRVRITKLHDNKYGLFSFLNQ